MEVFTLQTPTGFPCGIQTTVTLEIFQISGFKMNRNLENGGSAIYPKYSCDISDSQTTLERVESGSLNIQKTFLFFFTSKTGKSKNK